MAGDPAVIKVRDAAVALILAGKPAWTVDGERGEEEPIQETERPAALPRISNHQFEAEMGLGEMRHRCILDIDLYEVALSDGGMTKELAIMVADVNALFHADRTLGGMVESLEFIDAITDPNETPDMGVCTLRGELTFITPRGDFTTIQGASGIF
jgi:hypothetical protein